MASGNAQVSVAPPTNAASQAPESVPRRTRTTAPESFDLARLERAVRVLLADQNALRQENADLYAQLRTATNQVQLLEDHLLASNQRRHDAVKRVDDLIASIEKLEPRLAGGKV